MISCKEATMLTLKKEEGKLSLIERLKLKLHLGMCKFCTLFSIQSKYLSDHAKHMDEHIHSANTLPESDKIAINRNLI